MKDTQACTNISATSKHVASIAHVLSQPAKLCTHRDPQLGLVGGQEEVACIGEPCICAYSGICGAVVHTLS